MLSLSSRTLATLGLFGGLLLGSPVHAAAKKEQDTATLGIIEQIYAAPTTQQYLKRTDRYQAPAYLTDADADFQQLEEADKEAQLLAWFVARDKAFYRYRAYLLLCQQTLLLLGFGFISYHILWPIVQSTVGELKGYFFPDAASTEPPAWRTLLVPLLVHLAGHNQSQALTPENHERLTEEVTKGISRFSSSLDTVVMAGQFYALYQSRSLWQFGYQVIHKIYLLLQFLHQDTYEDPLKEAEHVYIKSLHLFDAHQKRTIAQLLRAKRHEPVNLSEATMFIRRMRAVPHGICPVSYRQEVIDKLFADYSTEHKKLAERIIMTLVIYTKALQLGDPEVLDNVPLKAILLLGPPGTGKSHFIKQICKALGINCVDLNLTSDASSELTGQIGEKVGLGIPSAYSRALEHFSDSQGRTYQNSVLCFEEVDKFLDSPAILNLLHRFFDPKVTEITDDYLGMEVPKMRIIFATSNYPLQVPALNDRFQIYHFDEISRTSKEKIACMALIPQLQNFFAQERTSAHPQGVVLDAADWRAITEEVLTYIREEDHQPGMRGIEEFAMEQALAYRVEKEKSQTTHRVASTA